ncbi:hypothetical protein [Catellatospora coxensis]|uniref:Uncharacterized protein n=1 Tax=Catellatospora coxensis TaxID=310354 RepID=A0A8J3KUP8_9ACTN|nr:hypothetical protein [Catellatospora coxensis]GIG08963.1 hypothetical protein Cco03nite_56630 [Catellatospora coxensis]
MTGSQKGNTMNQPLDPESNQANEVISSNQMVKATQVASKPFRRVSITLTTEQQDALQEITGERITELNIEVEDLADLADMVAN